MSKQITVSDETWDKIKDIVMKENKEKIKKYTKSDLIKLLKTDPNEFNRIVRVKSGGGNWEDLPKIEGKLDLREANLQGANLQGANLQEADLRGANLWRANLQEADLLEADLRGANLRGADLQGADLRGANLQGANLWGADLRRARFYGKRGKLRIKKDQLENFMAALGYIIEDK